MLGACALIQMAANSSRRNSRQEDDATTANHLLSPALVGAVPRPLPAVSESVSSEDESEPQYTPKLVVRHSGARTYIDTLPPPPSYRRIACNNKRAEDMQYDQYLDCAIVDVRRLLATGRLSQEEYTGILRARRRNTNRLASAKRRITQLGGKTSSPTSPASSSPSSQQPQRLAMLEELRQLQEREAGLRSAIAAKEQQLASIE